MTKHYTELTGENAERIQFGAARHDAVELFGGHPPSIRIGSGLQAATFELLSVTALGVSWRMPDDSVPASFNEEPLVVAFVQKGNVLVERDALAPSIVAGNVYEARFVDKAVDLDDLVSRNAAIVARVLKTQPIAKPQAVPTVYKAFCADVLDFLGRVRTQLTTEIDPIADDLSVDERAALDQEIEDSIRPQWQAICRQGNQLTLPYRNDPKRTAELKRYTENVVSPVVCASPVWDRAYSKPLGYPGDYMIMNSIYDHKIVGDTAYMRLLGALGYMSANPVALRMKSFLDVMVDRRAAHPDQSHFHMMSIGAGPAREMREFFTNDHAKDAGFSMTLVDTEARALEYAINSIYSGVKSNLASVMVSGMNTSFTEMLRPSKTFRHLPPQDLIYSSGLTDYLNDRLTHSLVKKLYANLKPGGTVVIGNINNAEDGMYWSAECVLDWTMYFRTEEDMVRIADGLPGNVEIGLDKSGSYYLLSVTKPA